jgi:flagellar protein FlaG
MRVDGNNVQPDSSVQIKVQGNSQPDKTQTNDEKVVSTQDKSQAKQLPDDLNNVDKYTKEAMTVSEKAVIDAIEKANKALQGPNTRFQFSVHKKTHEIMVKVIDNDTGKVIREVPPEKTLDLVAKMWEMAGIIVDERR